MNSINVDPQNPWPGLASFTEESRAFFHGRDEEIAELSRRVQRKLLTVLFGQSGLGKTSILRAGVVPRLRNEDYCPVYVRVDYGPAAPPPSEQVKQAVLRATADAGTWTRPEASTPGETLWEFLHHRDDVLRDASGRTLTPLIVFDQFEEIFTLGQSDESGRDRATQFKEELADLVENRAPRALEEKLEQDDTIIERYDFARSDYRILISLREDYLPHLDTLKGRMPSITQNRLRLARMTGTQALDAVRKPGGDLVTEEVARAIVEFVAGARGGSNERLAEIDVEPPLLSVICRELNDRRRALGQAQITADLVTGNRREILTDFYDRSVADLPEAMRRFVEDKLLTKSGFRDNLALETALEEPGVTKPLIDTLVSRRLLRLEDRLGTQRVELTHDVLADVVRASRDSRQQRLLLEQAQERERQTLAAAARKARRMRVAIGGLAVAVVALCVGAVFGLRAQRRSAQQAGRSDLLLGSRFLDEGKLSEGLAYLVSAGRKDPANELVPARLLTTLVAHNFCLPVGSPLVLPSAGVFGAFSPDGRWLAVQCDDDVTRIIATREWRVARELQTSAKIRRNGLRWAAKAPDVLAVILVDGSIVVLDVASGQPRGPTIVIPNAAGLGNFAISPDGRWVAASPGGEMRVWKVETAALSATLPNPVSTYSRVNFSPDSQRVVTTFGDRVTQMWNVVDGAPVGARIEPPGENRLFINATFTADGQSLFVWHGAGGRLVDAFTGVPRGPWVNIPVNTVKQLEEFVLSPDGHLGALNNGAGLTVFNLMTGEMAFELPLQEAPVNAHYFSADGTLLLTNSVDGLFRMWSMETGELVAEPTFQQERYAPAILAPDSRTVAILAPTRRIYRLQLGTGAWTPLTLPRHPARALLVNFDRTSAAKLLWFTPTGIKAVDVRSGRETSGSIPFPQIAQGVTVSTFGASLMGPGQRIIARIRENEAITTHAWLLEEGGKLHDVVLESSTFAVTGLTMLNPIGHYFAAGDSGRTRIAIWDTRTGKPVMTFPHGLSRQMGAGAGALMSFSADERLIAFLDGNQVVHVCEILTGKEHFVLEPSSKASFSAVRFTLDGRHILTGDDWGAVQLWDAATGKLIQSTQAHRFTVGRFDFSPDEKFYASLSNDGSVQVWDASTHKAIGPLLSQKGAPSRVAFGPENRRILTPSLGGTARVWDVATGLPLTEPLPHDKQPITVVGYSPDGRFITTQSADRLRARAAGMQIQRLWPSPPSAPGMPTPRWLLDLATICAGKRLLDDGKLASAAEDIARIEEVRREIASLPEDNAYGRWARWFLSDDPNRPIAPEFTITPAEAVKLQAEFAAPPDSPSGGR